MLRTLALADNMLTSSIPPELGSLSSLCKSIIQLCVPVDFCDNCGCEILSHTLT